METQEHVPPVEIDAASVKILVVDDNPQNVELLQAFLASAGYNVITALDGDEALEKVEAEDPDLVLLDIMMPKVDGFQACRQIKARERFVPVIMITAYDEIANIEKGVEVGTDDFLAKPINRLELLTRVKSLLRVRHYKSELDRLMHYIESIEE